MSNFSRLIRVAETPFTSIHYYKVDSAADLSAVFSWNIVALDLAASPRALQLAIEHGETTTTTLFSPSPGIEFPRGYRPFPVSQSMPLLQAAIRSYEARILRHDVLSERRSVPILFDSASGTILPTPLVVEHPLPKRWGGMIPIMDWLFPYFESRRLTTFPRMDPFNRRMDAYFLNNGAREISVTFHASTDGCKPSSRPMKFDDCSANLFWKQQRYERRCFTQFQHHPPPRSLVDAILISLGSFVLFVVRLVVALVVVLPFSITIYFFLLNSLSGGALLAKLAHRLQFLDAAFVTLDMRICPAVVLGGLPCIIPANPDVAGIGGRIALYVQAISLITLLTFSPTQAGPSRWSLAVTSLSFGLSTLVSAGTNQLTLYHIILAAKFQSLPLFLTTIVEFKSPPSRGAPLFIVQRMRWFVNAAIILWYSITAACFGAQPACNSYVRSQSYFAIRQSIGAPQSTAPGGDHKHIRVCDPPVCDQRRVPYIVQTHFAFCGQPLAERQSRSAMLGAPSQNLR